MPVTITAKKDGFRRCGMAHPASPVEHPDGTFTEKELEILRAEPMLVVQEVSAKDPLEAMTKDKLVALLTEKGASFDPKAKKDELLAIARSLSE